MNHLTVVTYGKAGCDSVPACAKELHVNASKMTNLENVCYNRSLTIPSYGNLLPHTTVSQQHNMKTCTMVLHHCMH